MSLLLIVFKIRFISRNHKDFLSIELFCGLSKSPMIDSNVSRIIVLCSVNFVRVSIIVDVSLSLIAVFRISLLNFFSFGLNFLRLAAPQFFHT